MSFNDLMHPRNPYKTRPDFKVLASEYPEFRNHVFTDLRGNLNLNFKTGVGVLTKILLKKDFGIDLELPDGALVPTLPLRFNYLLWIQDILNCNEIKEDVKGLDIGVGSSCIYPLLAAKHFRWKMFGNESHEESLAYAQSNVSKNALNSHILLSNESSNFHILSLTDERVHFTMCNPPFFDSDSFEEEEPRPGMPHEMATHGGEFEFVKNMILQSYNVSHRVGIFTCMLGKKSSLLQIKVLFYDLLKKCEPGFQWSFTEFCQGKTMRWGIAWTFIENIHLPKESPLANKRNKQKKLTPMSFNYITEEDCQVFYARISHVLTEDLNCKLSINGKYSARKVSCSVETNQTLWKHQRKLRREKMRQDENPPCAKKIKNDSSDDHESSSNVLKLSFEMNMHRYKNEIITEFLYMNGEVGRDGLHQVIQYLKNKLEIR